MMSNVMKKKMLEVAIEAAWGAGRVIMERYPRDSRVTIKGYRNLVTDTDIAVEKGILDLIRIHFPDHTIVSEEAEDSEIGSGYTWVVDPLDGTTNYIHHHPVFAVSIGVLEGGEPLIGIIHDPLRDHTFMAVRGGGAFLNNSAIRFSHIKKFNNALLGFDWGHSNEERDRILTCLHQVVPRCGTLRVLGSAALSLAYVAAGRLDAYFNLGLKPWDAAAGMLIVTEAGGRCSTLEGKPYQVDLPSCLATNGFIHDELLTLMGKLDRLE
jgi:myo-inositol-1(or 4)-monophosphatase